MSAEVGKRITYRMALSVVWGNIPRRPSPPANDVIVLRLYHHFKGVHVAIGAYQRLTKR